MIKIINRGTSFGFNVCSPIRKELNSTPSLVCDYCVKSVGRFCSMPLSGAYSYIIINLRKAGLLQPDFEPICCRHYLLKKLELLDRDKEISFYVENKDLQILFDNGEKIIIPNYGEYFKDGIIPYEKRKKL